MTTFPPTRLLVGLLLLLFASGCAAVRTLPEETAEPVPDQTLSLEGLVFQAGSDADGEATVDIIDVREVLDAAIEALREERFDEAIAGFERAWPWLPSESWQQAVQYNLGLAYEGAGRSAQAAAAWSAYIAAWPGHRDAGWAMLRLADAYAALERWSEIPPLMDRLLQRAGLQHRDRIEAHLRAGHALLESGRLAEAESRYRTLIRLNQDVQRAYDPMRDGEEARALRLGDNLIAEAHYARGRVFHLLFLEVPMQLPTEALREALQLKNDRFEQARMAYREAIRSGHPLWSPAAGTQIGLLYEDVYRDILATEIPLGYGELELGLYFEELRTFLQPSLTTALRLHEETLAMAYRLGAPNSIVEESLAHIQRLQEYQHTPERWEAENRLISEQVHPRSPPRQRSLEFRPLPSTERPGPVDGTPES